MLEEKKIVHNNHLLTDEILNNCIHCGLCLPTCPTYALTSLEQSSPRGRIRLIRAALDGDQPISKEFIYEMNFCLDCQACETACPAGIKYGSLVETARDLIHQSKKNSLTERILKKFFLTWTFARHERLKFMARLLRWYQTAGPQAVLEKSGLLKLISKKLNTIQLLAPRISKVFTSEVLDEIILPQSEVTHTVVFLTGCIMDVAFAEINEDTIRLLLHHGCKVVIPKGQRCCGSLQAHNGDSEGAREHARYTIELFAQFNPDYIVMNSAGCGAFLKQYGELFDDDPVMRSKAQFISQRTVDVTEFLIRTGFIQSQKKYSTRYAGKRITYHDACHLIHSQKISEQPRELIRSVPGIEYVELPEASWCCGSAGIYNITHIDQSMHFLKRKIENIRKINPDIILMGNPGCMLQMQFGLRNAGLQIELLHTVTFLRRICEA
ncbi:MAG: (Fe-S)-binding protein [Ignavibacteriae bacterium]|nr:MAG: (Fe-S)-binding protein [Ignavibacteriota bacterium]